jgi:hypothetical protein
MVVLKDGLECGMIYSAGIRTYCVTVLHIPGLESLPPVLEDPTIYATMKAVHTAPEFEIPCRTA